MKLRQTVSAVGFNKLHTPFSVHVPLCGIVNSRHVPLMFEVKNNLFSQVLDPLRLHILRRPKASHI